MKQIIILLIIAIGTIHASAQSIMDAGTRDFDDFEWDNSRARKFSVGAYLYDNPKIDPNTFGCGIAFRYNITEPLRTKLSAAVLFAGDEGVGVDMSLDFQWTHPLGDKFLIYPSVGVGYLGVCDIANFSFLIGPGIEYLINNHLSIGFEFKGQITAEGVGLPITLGVDYTF